MNCYTCGKPTRKPRVAITADREVVDICAGCWPDVGAQAYHFTNPRTGKVTAPVRRMSGDELETWVTGH